MMRRSSSGGESRSRRRGGEGGDRRSFQASRLVFSPAVCGDERSGPDLRGRSRVEAGMEKHPGRRGHLGQPPRRRDRHARAGEALRRRPGQRLSTSAGAGENGDRDGAEDVLPTTPIWESARGCRHPSARQTGSAENAGAALRACRRYRSSPEPGLDVGDPDAAVGGGDLGRAWRRRSANGAMPATGLQRVLRRHQPPHFVEIETLQRQAADMQVPAMRRVERPAEQPDAAASRAGSDSPLSPSGERVGLRGRAPMAAGRHPHPPIAARRAPPSPAMRERGLSRDPLLDQGRTWPLPRTRYL